MEHFGEFIDYDEGRPDPREAFFAFALPCENCGEPCEDRIPAPWDEEIMVGPCCVSEAAEIPEIPACAELYRVTMQACTVGELVDASKAHKAYCQVCNPQVKEMREAA